LKLKDPTGDIGRKRPWSSLNSSGIKAFAKWIMKLQTVPEGDSYKILILQNTRYQLANDKSPHPDFSHPGYREHGLRIV
jgi:hypothetical protein